jgi:SnoaL-like domain
MADSIEERLAELEAKVKELSALEARVKELEDIREINEVFRAWHHACTGGFDGIQAGKPEALSVLADDATIEIKGLHKPGEGPRGLEEIKKYWDYYYGDKGPLPRVFQTSLDQHIEVDGDTATQESNQIIVFEFRGHEPVFGISHRTNDLVRTPDGWKLRKSTDDGGFTFATNPLLGRLNNIEPYEPREEWKRNPDDPTGHEFNKPVDE